MSPDRRSIRGGQGSRRLPQADTSNFPLVSVITAAFCAQDCVSNCIESVLAQSYPNIEHIVIDGGSDDRTVDILRSYDDKIDAWISEPDAGIYDAWNKGMNLARGEWIAFLGADDMYLPGAIRDYMESARLHPTADFLSSTAKLIHPSGYSPVFGGPWKWPACARALTTIHVGTMHRRSLFERYGSFDTSFKSAADYEFLLRAGSNLETVFLPVTTVIVRAGGASESSANLYERRRAKIQRGVRSTSLATIDLILDLLKFHIRRWMLALWSLRKLIVD
jgi:glycosyltransferase involved in cell wall biosynthesis